MIHSVGSQCYSLAIPVISQWAQEQSSHGGKDGNYAWASQHGLSFTKAVLAIAATECQISKQQRPTPRYHCGTIY